MQIIKHVTHVPVTEVVFYEGTEDHDLAEWLGGDLELVDPEAPEGLWKIVVSSEIGEDTVYVAGDIAFRAENGSMGWTPITKWSGDLEGFQKSFDRITPIGFDSQN